MEKKEHYQIRIHGIFESAHYLYDYLGPGKNEPLHGHTFEVEVFVRSSTLNNGITIDFLELQKELNDLVGTLDHKCINTVKPFDEINPTAENLAKHFHDKLKLFLNNTSEISEIKIWEGPNNHASYFPM